MTETHARRTFPPDRPERPVLAAVAAAAVGAGAFLAAPPAAAAEDSDPWVAELTDNPAGNVYRFTVPPEVMTEETGVEDGQVTVQGTFGPGGTWTEFNADAAPGGVDRVATFGPLDPGVYAYRYAVRPAPDADAVPFSNPGTDQEVTARPHLRTLFVPGPGAEWLADVDGGGALATLGYGRGKHRSEALVWTPPGYDAERTEPYPTLYLLQDEGQSYREWAELGRLRQILDNLVLDGDAEPMVVVMADGDGPAARKHLTKKLLPATESAFHVSSDAGDRAVAGIGRGARQALETLVTDVGTFASVGAFSGGLDRRISHGTARRINDRTDLIRVYGGNATDPAYDDVVALEASLTRAGVEFQSDGSDPATGGTWDTWRKSLHDFAGRLFRSVEDDGPGEGHRPFTPRELPAPGTSPTPWVDENGIVTFEAGPEFAEASRVTVWGNFGPAGSWPRTPMQRQHDGSWRLSMPVEGGSYYYKFEVEGVDQKDPNNPTSVTSEPAWSTFTVEGDTLRGRYTAAVPAGERGEVSVMNYTSTAGQEERSAYVWTPPDYDADRADEYPVFYLQHGGGQTWTDWVEVGHVDRILDNHYRNGAIEPMVVVMANGNGVDFPQEMVTRIAPAAEERYNVGSEPRKRALAGLSMGSGHTLSTLWTYPGEFGYIGAMSAFGAPPEGTDVDAVNAGTELIRVYSGDQQDFTYGATLDLVAAMEARGVEHEFAPIIPGPHGWDVWQKALIDLLPRLFTGEN
ncbi:alpha/beta hydrolase-fold protein [Myceligenerans xiligouense]|uniref:Enterochelin esterase-like enzyme n=1 Tax=Myceligenerans xiligouense TaxID=253184 RepID=A0A3N4YQZ1_9MICO|nr:alpha/beta hydrolase-fold protein [Myceligenerans xiligouense]RPF22527.1 enterochelin esterase-like enzyme [Myceligenerans xiligouense]